MATQGTYYLDAPSLSAASVIYDDANLTTVAADGFYSDGVISREQASGVLLPQVACPSCNNEFLVGFGASADDACLPTSTGTVTGDDPTFCDCTTFTGAIFSAASTGTYHVSFGGYSLEVSVTNGNPIATVTGVCATCTPSYSIGGCGVSNVSVGASCSDAGSNPKTLYSDCPVLSLAPGCGLYWDAALQSPVTELYVFANANWDMDGNGIIVAYSSVQC
jgi:hypothetical protein